jgi:hypothetical protein
LYLSYFVLQGYEAIAFAIRPIMPTAQTERHVLCLLVIIDNPKRRMVEEFAKIVEEFGTSCRRIEQPEKRFLSVDANSQA